jgi:PPOX class probable F420-dependent enzyme
MVTLRSGGGLQTSPVIVGIDGDGKVVISSRETTYKVRNLRRRPTATLCVFSDNFFGHWIQIDGTTEIIPLPQAMDGLVDYYRRISGEHPDWDDYRHAMVDQQRVLIRLTIDNLGPTPRRVATTPRPGNVEAEDGIANATPQNPPPVR